MKILITGGAGFVGSSLADALLQKRNYEIVLVDNLLTGKMENLPQHPNCRFIKCDVNNYNDIAAICLAFRFDYVFHYAAVVGVKRTLENPVMVLNDLQGIKNILDLCKNTGVRRIFFSSSSEVYGEPVQLPQHEHTTPLNSRLPYAVIKNVGESAIASMSAQKPFKSLFDFCERVDSRTVNKRVIESLIKAGAFDSVNPARALLTTISTARWIGGNANSGKAK